VDLLWQERFSYDFMYGSTNEIHAVWFIRETVKLRLDPILGSVSYLLIVKLP